MRNLNWHKSSHSGPNTDDCVEVANLPGAGMTVRDSKNPNGAILTFASAEWIAFIRRIKDGGFA